MKKTILIFGISSFVGSNLAQFLRDDYRIVGTYHDSPVEIDGITCYPCDVLKKDYVATLVSILKPDVTVYAIGMSSLSQCKASPKLADALNSVGAANVCRAAERINSKFVYISSSFVLGGENIPYSEADIPIPNTAYGTSVSNAEFYVQRSCINYLILRSCPLYGWSFNPIHPNWFETVQANLSKSQQVYADDTVTTGYLDVAIFAKVLKACIDLNITNRLLQVSSSNIMTRKELALQYAKVFKKDESLIHGSSLGLPVEGKNNTQSTFYKMDITNLESVLGSKLPKIEESMQYTWQRLNH